jgi:hypothetical protein
VFSLARLDELATVLARSTPLLDRFDGVRSAHGNDQHATGDHLGDLGRRSGRLYDPHYAVIARERTASPSLWINAVAFGSALKGPAPALTPAPAHAPAPAKGTTSRSLGSPSNAPAPP